jgi:hypoxanthine phosphoribosyltransferase
MLYFCPVKNTIQLKGLTFKRFISKEKIIDRVLELASQINSDYAQKQPVFLPILNGSFMFASDLIKHINFSCQVSFVKISSYAGTQSTGNLKTLIGHEDSLFNQDIIIVEDIVDTGLTLQLILDDFKARGAKSVETVSLLRKQKAREKEVEVKYVGFELEEQFVVGYGLDYDGLGRNLSDIYEEYVP